MASQLVFRAISDPTRRGIIALLADADMSVGDVAKRFDMTRPAVAKHLGVLKSAGLVVAQKQGRETINRLRPQALRTVAEWLSLYGQYWDDKLDKLKTAVENDYD